MEEPLRKLIIFNMISLDGYFEGPKHEINWHNVIEVFNEWTINQLESADMLLFGRATYELMAGYWPAAAALENNPFVARRMNDLPKIVFSKSLNTTDWSNTRLV